MKKMKLTSLLLAALMALSLSGCGHNSETPDANPAPDVETIDPGTTHDTESKPEINIETDKLQPDMVILDNDEMKVVVSSIEISGGIDVEFTVTNKTAAEITPNVSVTSINNVAIVDADAVGSKPIPANDTRFVQCAVRRDILTTMGTNDINMIGVICDGNTYENILDTSRLQTMNNHLEETVDVYSDDAMDCTAIISGGYARFLVTNKTGTPLVITIDSIAAENGTHEPNLSITLTPHAKAVLCAANSDFTDSDYTVKLHHQLSNEVGADRVAESRVDSGEIHITR